MEKKVDLAFERRIRYSMRSVKVHENWRSKRGEVDDDDGPDEDDGMMMNL